MSSKERTSFTLSPDVKAELENLVPKNQRSQFIEQAVITALKEQRKREVFDLIDSIEPVSISQKSSDLINDIRSSGMRRLIHL